MILRILFSALFTLAAARATGWDIRFSTDEGYPAEIAPLNGTPGGSPVWLTTSGGFTVNGTEKKITANPEGETANALLQKPIPLAPGETVAISVEFQFAGLDWETAGGTASIHGPGIALGASPEKLHQTVFGVLFGHFPWADSEYVLQVNPGGKFASLSGGELGLEQAGKPGDRLRYTLELTKGNSANEWRFVLTLHNVTKDSEVIHIEGTDIETPQEFFDSPDLYLNLGRGNAAQTGGPASVTFSSIKMETR